MLTTRELVIDGHDHTGPVVTVTDGQQTTCYSNATPATSSATSSNTKTAT